MVFFKIVFFFFVFCLKKPPGWEQFKASDRWRDGFYTRHGISIRKTTNKKQKSAKERQPKCWSYHNFLVNIRIEESFSEDVWNMDEVPIEFGGLWDTTAADT